MKLEHPEFFGQLSIRRTLMLIAEITIFGEKSLNKNNISILQEFAYNYKTYDEESLEKIIRLILQ